MNNGGPAFPRSPVIGQNEDYPNQQAWWDDGQEGMSLRDYFAAKAMQGLIAYGWHEGKQYDAQTTEELIHQRAKFSYMHADAMLKAREVEL